MLGALIATTAFLGVVAVACRILQSPATNAVYAAGALAGAACGIYAAMCLTERAR